MSVNINNNGSLTKIAGLVDSSEIKQDIADIQAVIPSDASSSNQLVTADGVYSALSRKVYAVGQTPASLDVTNMVIGTIKCFAYNGLWKEFSFTNNLFGSNKGTSEVYTNGSTQAGYITITSQTDNAITLQNTGADYLAVVVEGFTL